MHFAKENTAYSYILNDFTSLNHVHPSPSRQISSSIIFLEYLVNTESSRYDYLANIFNVKYDIYTNKLLQNTIVH